MKYLFIGFTLLLALMGIIFYTNMMHFACILSMTLALICGGFFARYLSAQYENNLRNAELVRRRLTADVAHELRTPLAAVSASLEAIAEGALEPTPERIGKCYDEVQRLSKLVADMENLARTESGILHLHKQPVDLLEIAREVFGSANGVSTTVNADRERLIQVLTNLKSNAEKYGGDLVTATVHDSHKYGQIDVSDNGDGISPQDLPHIFERFYRADKSRSRSTGGAGIGLALVKMIVDAHAGSITVESEVGKGSTFTLKLNK